MGARCCRPALVVPCSVSLGDDVSTKAAGFVGNLHLGEVDGQVAGEPPVSRLERLGLCGLGIPHDFEPVAEGLEIH